MRDILNKIDHIFLMEGGNIWKGELSTSRINKKDVIPTVKFLEKITGLPLTINMLGTTGKKDTSGDIDLAVDGNNYSKEELQTKLNNWATKNDPSALTKKTGISVHFRTPINGNPKFGYVQTDFMFIDDLQFTRWSMNQPPSFFKGASKHILLASVAKPLGYKWSFLQGLTNRQTGELVKGGRDENAVAKILFGPNAEASTIRTVENMLAALENDPNKEVKLADAQNSIGKEIQDYYHSKKNLNEDEEKKLTKDNLLSLLKDNGYNDIKIDGNRFLVLVQIPDGEKKNEFRKANMSEILNHLQKSVPELGPTYTPPTKDKSMGSLGGITFAASPYKIGVKDKGVQGSQSAGVGNEIELGGMIQSVIEKYGSANVTFTDPRGVKLSISNANRVVISGRSTAGRKKADVEIFSIDRRLPISIKEVNAEMWESADRLFGQKARSIIEKLVSEGAVELIRISEPEDPPIYQLSKEIVIEPTEEEALQAIFGSDINPEGGIVIQTFKPQHFKQDKNNINIDAHAVIITKDDIPESHIMYWLLRNNKDRNSKSLGIPGIRPMGVTATRAFGKSGTKNVVFVNSEGNVTETPSEFKKKPTSKDIDFAKASQLISKDKSLKKDKKEIGNVGREKR